MIAKTLFILNDPPYGTERSYNAFGSLVRSQSASAPQSAAWLLQR
jgi:hypothetical protein